MNNNKIKGSVPYIFMDDRRRPQVSYRDRLYFHIKAIIKLLLELIIKRKTDKIDKFSGEIKVSQETSKYEVSLFLIYEGFSDYDILSSRYVLLFGDISEDKPVSILSTPFPLKSNKIRFSLFLYKQMKWAKTINIRGYIEHAKKEIFDINLSSTIINEVSQTTYWLNVILDLSGFNLPNSARRINVFLTRINIDNDNNDVFPYYVISPDVPKISKKHRSVFVFSFDGITTEDIFGTDKTYGSIRSFAQENYWFENAVTSSAVTASSAASLMTGLNLAKHFIYIYKKNYLSSDLKTISHDIKTLGQKVRLIDMHSYGLFAFGKWSPQYGYARGFTEYRCVTAGDITKYPWLDESIKTITNNIENPHIFTMHHPGGHPPFLPEIITPYFDHEYSLYHKNLDHVDRFFGNLIRYLKINNIYDNALIIFMSDHGRSLSGLKENEFHFLENRLRVPLIIKNPDWDDKSSNEFNLKTHISVQTMVHEIILQFLGIKSLEKPDFEYRTVDGITWVSETVDYKRMNWHGDEKEGYIGLVGYDDEYKYTLYYNVDFELFLVKEPSGILRYQLSNSGIAESKGHNVSINENRRIKNSAFDFLNSGISFAKTSPPEKFGDRTSMINISS